MKIRLMAVVAAIASVLLLSNLVQAAPGPQDHSWSVALSTYANGSNPDTIINLELGTSTAPSVPHPAAFFDQATTTYSGLTPNSASAANLGSKAGTSSFTISSNVNPALIASNNIKSNGQPPQCNEAGTIQLPASAFDILASTVSTSNVVSSAANPGNPPFSFDQEPNNSAGGVPMGVTHVPDWYVPVLSASGIPTSLVVSRGFGVAQATANTATSVNFLTVNALGGNFASVTVLGNPIAGFNPASQTNVTCTPFTSNVTTFGNSQANAWNCTNDYFGNPVPGGCSGTTSGTSFATTTITGANGTTHSYRIALSGGANLDNDVTPGGDHLFNTWDNCNVDANPTQADANSNGIGNACKGGGSWVNSNAGAITNASLTCASIATAPPFNACQDADGDGALNSTDNCPLVANPDQADSDRDGIGDACDPAPAIRGTGTGYAPAALAGVTTTGTYIDFDDICDDPFEVGLGSGSSVCLAQVGVPVTDSNDNGYPDFMNPGSGQACVQDHKSDSNNDGYTDSDQGTPPGSKSCTGAFPSSGGLGQDPLKACPGREGNPTALNRARSDVNLDGNVNILDLSQVSGQFLVSVATLPASDSKHELDVNGDGNINILDLSIQSGQFLTAVPAC